MLAVLERCVTERTAALEEKQQILSSIIECVSTSVVVADQDGVGFSVLIMRQLSIARSRGFAFGGATDASTSARGVYSPPC